MGVVACRVAMQGVGVMDAREPTTRAPTLPSGIGGLRDWNVYYVRTKSFLRRVLEELGEGQGLQFSKVAFWCRNCTGYHYDLFVWKGKDGFRIKYTWYHEGPVSSGLKDLDGAVEAVWRWIKHYKTRRMTILPTVSEGEVNE